MDLENLRISLLVETGMLATGFAQGLRLVSQFVSGSSAQLNKLAGVFDKVASTSKFAGPLGLALGAVALAMGVAIGPAIQFESAFAGVTKTVNGTEAQLAGIRDGLLGLAGVMPTTATELASIAENAGQLNVAAGDVLVFTEVIAKLGETTDLSFDAAAQSLARFLNITGGGTGMIEEVANIIVELGNNSATTESQIVSFAMRLSGAFAAAGASEGEILAVAAAYSSLGIEAEAGGTALSRVIVAMTDAAIAGGPKLKTFADTAGLLPEEFAAIVRENPVEALLLFEQGLGGVLQSAESITPILDDLDLSGHRITDAMKRGALGSDQLTKALQLQEGALLKGNALQEEYGKRLETTAARIDVFKNQMTGLAISVGSVSLDAFAAGVDMAGDAVRGMTEILGPAASEIASFVGGVAGVGADLIGFFGSPALQVAGALLVGISLGLEGVFSMLNSLGPAAEYVAAGIGLFFAAWQLGILSSAGTTILGLAFNMAFFGVSTTGAAAGLTAMAASARAAAASIGLIAAPIAIVVAIGKAFHDADQKAQDFVRTMEDGVADALARSDFEGAQAQVNAMTAELERLRGELVVTTEGAVGFGERWLKGTGYVIQGAADATLGVVGLGNVIQTTGLESIARMEELEAALGTREWQFLRSVVDETALALGLTSHEVLVLANETGTLDGIMHGASKSGLAAFEDAVYGVVEGQRAFAEASGVTVDSIENGTVTLQDYGDNLGITADQVGYLVSQIEDVELDDLFDPDEAAAAATAIAYLDAVYGELAASVGITKDEFYSQKEAITNLAVAHGALGRAIEGATTRQDQMMFSAQMLQTAQEGVVSALVAYSDGSASVEDLARSFGALNLAQQSSGISAGEAERSQAALVEAFRNTEAGAKLTDEALDQLIIDWILLTDTETADLAVTGQDSMEAAEAVAQKLWEVLRGIDDDAFVAEVAADFGTTPEDFLNLLEAGNEWALSVWEAALTARNEASLELELALAQLGIFDAATAEAMLTAGGSAQEDVAQALLDLGLFDGAEAEAFLELDADGAASILTSFLDSIPTTRTIGIQVSTSGSSGQALVASAADGGVFEYYRNGGRSENHVAQIAQGRTPYRVWAEPETGGEAYIPLGSHKRGRSTSILRDVASRFGYGLKRFEDGGVIESFADGGLSQARFMSSVNLPDINLLVSVDTTAVGELTVDLGGAEDMITRTGKALGDAAMRGGELRAMVESIRDEAQQTGRAMLESLRPEEFLQKFSQISGWAQESFVEWLGEWDGSVDSALLKLDAAGLEMGHIFTAISEEGKQTAEVMFLAFEETGGLMTAAAQDAGRDMLLALDPEPFLETFTRISGWATDSFVEWLGEWDGTVAEAVRLLEDAGLDMSDVFGTMFREGATASEILLTALDDVAAATEATEDAARRAEDAYHLLSGVMLDTILGQFDYLDAVEKVNDAIKDEEESFDKLSKAARGNYEDLIRAGEAMAEYAIRIAEGGAGAAKAIEEYDRLRQEFVELAIAAGLPQDEIKLLTDLLFALPTEVITEIAVEGEAAKAGVDEVLELLAQFEATEAIATLDADSDPAEASIEGVMQQAVDFAEAQYLAALDVDPESAETMIAEAKLQAVEFALEEYEASLTADGAGAKEATILVTNVAVTYADAEYEADLTADPTQSLSSSDAAQSRADVYAIAKYDASLTATNTDSLTKSTAAQTRAQAYATARYNSTLTATDSASGTIGAVISKLGGFVSKNITLTTNYRSVYTSAHTAPSGDVVPNLAAVAAGAFVPGAGDFANGHLPEIVPAGAWRVFAEDETGGEAYVPLANDWRRPRAVGILGQVADQFGYSLVQLAGGGMSAVQAGNMRPSMSGQPIINIAPGAVVVGVEVPLGADSQQVGKIAREAVKEGLGTFSRDLADMAGSFR